MGQIVHTSSRQVVSVQDVLVTVLETHQNARLNPCIRSSSKLPCLDDTDIMFGPGFQGIKVLILFNVTPLYLYGAKEGQLSSYLAILIIDYGMLMMAGRIDSSRHRLLELTRG